MPVTNACGFSSGIQWPVAGTRRPLTSAATSRIISSTIGPEVLMAPSTASTEAAVSSLRLSASGLSSASRSNVR